MTEDTGYPSTADVMRLVKPTYVGSHRRPDDIGPGMSVARGLRRRNAIRLLGPIVGGTLTGHAADEELPS